MSEPTLARTGAQYDIAAGDYTATITELGAGLRGLTYRDEQVIRTYDRDELPPAGAGQLLSPWPNRVDHGRYSFGGGSYQLDISEIARDNAIHGLTRWASWQVTAHSADRVELGLDLLGRPGYPFCLELQARYQLDGAGLEVTITARNSGRRAAPFGIGMHPYFLAGSGLVDEWRLQLPATHWQPADDRGIPAGPPQPVAGSPYDFRAAAELGDTVLDHPFTGLQASADGRVWVRLTGPGRQIALWLGAGFGWLQVFTGDPLGPDARRRAVAIEPMTCPPNAFATGTDLLAIEPGGSIARQFGVQVTPG